MTSRRKKSREKGGCSTLMDWPGSRTCCYRTYYQDRVNHRPGESTITHTCTFSLNALNTSLRTTNKAPCQPFFVVSGGKNCPQSIQARTLNLWSLCISLTKHNSTIEDYNLTSIYQARLMSTRGLKQAAVAFSVISASIVSKQQHFLNL